MPNAEGRETRGEEKDFTAELAEANRGAEKNMLCRPRGWGE
jgi:hypothetical protein